MFRMPFFQTTGKQKPNESLFGEQDLAGKNSLSINFHFMSEMAEYSKILRVNKSKGIT